MEGGHPLAYEAAACRRAANPGRRTAPAGPEGSAAASAPWPDEPRSMWSVNEAELPARSGGVEFQRFVTRTHTCTHVRSLQSPSRRQRVQMFSFAYGLRYVRPRSSIGPALAGGSQQRTATGRSVPGSPARPPGSGTRVDPSGSRPRLHIALPVMDPIADSVVVRAGPGPTVAVERPQAQLQNLGNFRRTEEPIVRHGVPFVQLTGARLRRGRQPGTRRATIPWQRRASCPGPSRSRDPRPTPCVVGARRPSV